MAAEVILVIVALIFFVVSIFLFQGKGKWFIAGFNTASKEERKNTMKRKYAGQQVLFARFARLCFA